MYKSLLSSEELNALLSPEQVTELTAADRPPGETQAPSEAGYPDRVQQLEKDIHKLLQRVGELESRLSLLESGGRERVSVPQPEYRLAEVHAAAAQVQALPQDQVIGLPLEAQAVLVEEPAVPLRLSRVETYKQQQKPKKTLFR